MDRNRVAEPILHMPVHTVVGDVQLTIGEPLRVRILYDNSGSMHPGYTAPGTPGRKTKSELGVRSFHEYPEFQQWLGDFVARQTILDGAAVGMWTFTSQEQFAPEDIHFTLHNPSLA